MVNDAAPTATSGDAPMRLRVSELVEFREGLAAMDRDLTDAERVDLLRALEEVTGSIAAAQATLAADLDASVREAQRSAGVPAARCGAGVAAQVALARRVSPSRGVVQLGLAKALTAEMPHTIAALAGGQLSEWRATLLVKETACLTREHREEIDEELCADPAGLEGWGDRQLVAEVRRLGADLEPEALVNRAKRAETDRRVTLRPAPDTMSQLSGLLPVGEGVAVYAALKGEADAARSRGDERTRGQVMADTLVERVTGQSRAEDVPVQVNLIMTDRSLLDADTEPAVIPGHGTVPAGCARDLITTALQSDHDDTASSTATSTSASTKAGSGSVGVWLRRLFTDPSGKALVAMESAARRAPAGLARYITARDQTCRTPWCDAPIRHIDHVQPHTRGGATEADNLEGLCEACNYVKEAPWWSTRASPDGAAGSTGSPGSTGPPVTTVTPTGHTYTSRPPAPPGAARRSRAGPEPCASEDRRPRRTDAA